MFKTLASAFKNKDIRKSLLITILLLLVYRLGCFLPIPGIDTAVYGYKVGNDDLGVLSLLNSITGSALANGSFLALGVTPRAKNEPLASAEPVTELRSDNTPKSSLFIL